MVTATRSKNYTRFSETDFSDFSDFTYTESESESESTTDASEEYSESDEDLVPYDDILVIDTLMFALKCVRQKGHGGDGLLRELRCVIKRIQRELDVSNRRMKRLLWDMGVCLSNAKMYGSAGALRRFLRAHPEHRVSPQRAKKAGVKGFLVWVW